MTPLDDQRLYTRDTVTFVGRGLIIGTNHPRRDETRQDEMGRDEMAERLSKGRRWEEEKEKRTTREIRRERGNRNKRERILLSNSRSKTLVERCRRDKRIDRSRMIVENDRARAISNVFDDNEPFYGHDPRPPPPVVFSPRIRQFGIVVNCFQILDGRVTSYSIIGEIK